MAKIVCKTCGEVIREDVDPESVDASQLSHDHDDDPTSVRDERSDPPEPEGGESRADDPDGGDDRDDDDPDTDDESDAGGDETPEDHDDDDHGDTYDRDPEGHGAHGSSDADADGMPDPADVAEEIADMDAADEDRASRDWYDVDPADDYQGADGEFRRRYERIQQQVQKDRSEVAERIEARTEAIRDDVQRASYNAEYIKSAYDWEDLRDDVVEAFKDLKTRDHPVPARTGDRLNMDAVVQRASGDLSQDKLFRKTQPAAKGDRVVGVSVDMSGSMYETKAKLAVAAICEAARIIGDDVVANAYKGGVDAAYGLTNENSSVGVMVGPDEDFEWSDMDAFSTGGGTPTPDGLYDIYQLMQEQTAREKVIICVTDGGANVNLSADGTTTTGDAVEDTARVARMARRDDMKVIGLGIGHVSDEKLSKQFGPNGYVRGDMDNLAQSLLEVYRDQLRV